MNLTEIKANLMRYLDGELDPASAVEVERALAEHPELQVELDEMKRVNAFAHEAVFAPAANVDLSGVYAGVMAKIAAEAQEGQVGQVRPSESVSFWSRVSTWLSEVVRFERPMVLVGVAAALLAVVVLSSSGDTPTPGGTGGSVAGTPAGTIERDTPRRRAPEGEVKAGVTVERLEASKGKVFVDFDQNDPEAPMVLWHVMDGEGIEAPKGL